VTGTTFDVGWKPEPAQLRIAMKAGTVRITGPGLGDGQSVGVGEPVTFSPSSAPSVALAEASSGREISARPAPREVPREPPWTELVDHGEHEQVLKKAEAIGIADVLATRGEADLMALADAARFSGRKPLARDALLTVRRRFPGGARAATATFLLGKLDDEAGRPADAAGWYERYLDEAKGGPLVMEASARAISAWKRAGDTARARASAESYLRRFPDGPSAGAAREILDR
jgi:TolA-binding protein